MPSISHGSPHIHGPRTVSGIMREVMFALLPGTATYIWFFGFGLLVQLAIAALVALVLEWWLSKLRGLEAQLLASDGSVLVLALLLVLAMPPYAPWWVTASAVAVAVGIGKHAYGGLGFNLFNPAMVGYAFVMICFPVELSRWPSLEHMADYPGPLDSVVFVMSQPHAAVDALTGATVLDYSRTQAALMQMQSEMRDSTVFGVMGGRGWESINAAFLLGGLWLCYRRIISWRIPAFVLVGVSLTATVFLAIDAEVHGGPLFHIFAGATILGAFFIATDPVSSANTPRGMMVYGFGAGVLIYVIRNWGHLPDSVAFAVLCMNAAAPAIDHFTQPSVYGHGAA